MYISTTGIGSPIAGLDVIPRRFVRETKFWSQDRSAITASPFFWLAASSTWKQISIPTLVQFCLLCKQSRRAAAPSIRWMRDPTRGGVATALNELARDCGLGVVLHEETIPLRDSVRGACELLGLDPLHIANEGQFLAAVAPDAADAVLQALRKTPGGDEACLIGEIQEQPAGAVLVTTRYGGTRIVDMLVGDPLPRIC